MQRGLRSSLLICLLLAAGPALAGSASRETETRQQIEAAEKARATEQAAQKAAAERAANAAADAQKLAGERAAALERLRQAEAATTRAADRMEQLIAERKEADARLAKRAESMLPLLPLIERLSLYPAETLLAIPAGTEERLRGVLVLQGLATQLQAESAALRREQDAVDAAAKAVEAELPKLEAARVAQAAAATALDNQLAASQAARQQAEGEAQAASKRAAEQAGKAESLRGVLAALETQRRAEEARAREEAARAERQKRAADVETARRKEAELTGGSDDSSVASAGLSKGLLTAPVAGTVFRAWGDETEAGPAIGISYHAAPAARVVSPCSGRVDFANSFRSYGLLVIIDCGAGYHAVLSGFDRLDTKVGERVQAGEPIGVMPSWDPASGNRPSLYVELRHRGQPVNPAPWLKARG